MKATGGGKLPPPLRSEAALRKAVKSLGHADLAGEAAPCIRLIPRSGRPPKGSSRLGGDPDLPAGLPWPLAGRKPLSFLAQIRLADLKGLEASRDLPAQGRLYFFADTPSLERKDAPPCAVIHARAPDPGLAPRPAPVQRGTRIPACDVFPALAVGFSPMVSLPERVPAGLDEAAADAYWSWVDPDATVHKLLGHPNRVQGLLEGRRGGRSDWRLLLQLDSDRKADMGWGGGGRLFFLIPSGDLARGDFRNCRVVMQPGG